MIKTIKNPKYNKKTDENDSMLVFISGNSTKDIVPLFDIDGNCDDVPVCTPVTVLGMGNTVPSGDPEDNGRYYIPPDTLHEATVQLVSHRRCRLNYKRSGVRITKSMLCAGGSNKDSCQGDSGGPLIIKGNNARTDVQIGIVSFGIGCAARKFPGVYTSVKSQMNFILRTLRKNDIADTALRRNVEIDLCN